MFKAGQRWTACKRFGWLLWLVLAAPLASASVAATGSVTISGTGGSTSNTCTAGPYGIEICVYTSISSSVSVTVNGVTATTAYSQGSAATIATALVTAINGTPSMPVTATASGSTVYLTSTGSGGGSYALSTGTCEYYQYAVTGAGSSSGTSCPSSTLSAAASGSYLIWSTATAVSSSADPSTYGGGVTFTATVSPSTATGTVTFMNGGSTMATASLSNGSASYSTAGLAAGTYSITASYGGDSIDTGSTSGTLTQTVNKATPAITWATPAAITYGTALSATQLDASAGVGGTFAYSPVSGTLLAAGSRTLSVTFTPSNTTDYNTASASVSLTVNPAALSIAANNVQKSYGQTLTFGAGQTGFTSSGLQNGDTIGSVTITASGGTTGNAAAGSYSLTPSAATGGTFTASNYAITYHNGTLTVGTAALSITANSASKTYGTAVSYGAGSTAFTSSGLQNGETIGSVTINASGGTAGNAAMGGYTLTPSAATGGTFTASNYTISYVSGTLTVNAAALSITANNASKTYGQTLSYGSGSTAFTSSGLQNGETVGSVTITAGGGTAGNAAVGGYTLTPSAATGGTFTASNYVITYYAGTLSVNAAALGITANNASKTYGQTVSYGSGSTAFTSSGLQNGETVGSVTITASGGTAANAAAGAYSLTPSAATGGTFNPGNYAITYYVGSLTVGKAQLTVAANNAAMAYGAGSLPTFTASYSGFVAGDTQSVLSGAPSFATTATASSPAGTYSITPGAGSLTAANYAFSFVNGTLTIATAPLTVTANNSSMTYGAGSLPTFTASYSGFVNGDTQAVLSGSPSLTTTATASSAVGAYTITAAQGTLTAPSSYTLVFVNGTLTVNKAQLRVTANNASMTYGAGSLPTLTASYSGFVNGDTQSVLSGSPSLSTTATASSPAGSYTITAAPGTLAAANYSLTFANGTLSVNKAVLTVTAQNAAMTYGAGVPALTYTITGFVNGDTQSSATTGAPSLSTAAAGSPVGSYPIAVAVGSLTAASYSFSLVNGTLTVNRAGLTVTANNLSINYGAAIPALTYTMKGLVNGDTQASATTGAPALTTTAIANSPAGSYPITVAAGTLAAANYSFGYVPGELAIWSLPSSLPSGVVNAAYSATLSAVGGQTPLTWSIASGSLPAGLSLNGSAGLISGTPSAAGTSAVTLQVQDTNGNLDSVALALTVVPQSPVIGSMAPASGPPGTLVTLFGTQFGSSNSPGSSLTVSGAAPPNMQWTNTVIMFQVPPTLPAGAASVLVTTSLGSSSSWTFTVLAPPTSQDTPCN